jgi:type IV pilus assembly protein PilE
MSEASTMHKQRGMSLIELLTAMTILGILSAIAIPAYGTYVRKAKRADAKTLLTSSAQQLERCYTRLSNYNDGTGDVNGSCPLQLGPNNPQTYSLRIDFDTTPGLPPGQSYTLTATPLGNQALDTQCGSYTLNQAGVQGILGGTARVVDCW